MGKLKKTWANFENGQGMGIGDSISRACHPERGAAESKGLFKTDFSTRLWLGRNDTF